MDNEGNCQAGDTASRCYYLAGGEGSECGPRDGVKGCGRPDGNPVYVEEGGRNFVGLVCAYGYNQEFNTCTFAAGGANVPECMCLCDGAPDDLLVCDQAGQTCTDLQNGLMWPTNVAESTGRSPYALAQAFCNRMTRGGHNDWRLPTLDELRTLVRGCPESAPDGACGVSDSCAEITCGGAPCVQCANTCTAGTCSFEQGACAGCDHGGGPNYDGCYLPDDLDWGCQQFWTSNVAAGSTAVNGAYWGIDFKSGSVVALTNNLPGPARATCVRNIDE
jgi:hypothetical protein